MRYPELIETIYEAVLHPQQWTPVLHGIAALLKAKDVSIGSYDSETRGLDVVCLPIDPSFMRAYSERWSSRNFLWTFTSGLPVRKLFSFESALPRQEFERTDFYNEWWHPQQMDHAIGANLLVDGPLSAVATAYRPKRRGAFDAEDAAAFLALTPHLQRAMELRQRLCQGVSEAEDFRTALEVFGKAAILVDRGCKLLYANAPAWRLIGTRALNVAANGILAGARADETASLQQLVLCTQMAHHAGGKLVLHRLAGRPITLLVAPLHRSMSAFGRRASLILIDDPDEQSATPSSSELLRLQYGLTKAEVRVALALAAGLRLRAAADRLGITFATARTHLAHIFHKTRVSSQAGLVRLLVKSGIDADDTLRIGARHDPG